MTTPSSPGRIRNVDVVRILSAADVCLALDPKNPLNDVLTMNKIVDYMALARPIVSYDLRETRVSAAAAHYAPYDLRHFAHCIAEPLDSPKRCERRGDRTNGRRRVSWSRSEEQLLASYTGARELRRKRR